MKITPLIQQRIRMWAEARGEAEPDILKTELTKPDSDGQSVALFACGDRKYIYKPRSCDTDLAWAQFMEAIEAVLDVPMPGTVAPLPPYCDEFTVVPCIENHEFSSEAELTDFYRRCGTLLALCMVLGSRDLHGDNLIADQGKPYLIDVELMLSGIAYTKAEDAPDLVHSLLNCHLLPHWSIDSDGDNIDRGGLSAYDDNLPQLYGLPFPPYLYIETIAEAFLDACRAILEKRSFISTELERFARVPFRKILRSNNLYRRFHYQLQQLESEAEKLESAQRLRRAYLKGPPGFAEIMERACESEIRAVLRNDLPTFFSYGGERCLRDASGVVADGYFAYSPLEAARLRLDALRWEDCEIQAKILRQSLRCTHPEISAIAVTDPMQVFELLESRAIPGLNSAWLGLTLNPRGEADFTGVGFSLFEGLSGILAFYASLYEATRSEAVREALLRRYTLCRDAYILNEEALKPSSLNLSLTDGIGGQILALVHCAACLKDESFLQDAALLLKRFPFDEYSGRDDADVYSGASGLLFALPALLGRGFDGQLRAIAAQLAEEIRHADAQVCGFGRGAAGIALGLGTAQYVTGVSYEEDILRLIEWETLQYNPDTLNWPDDGCHGQHSPGSGLCFGAPGIGLARMQLMRLVSHPRVLEICRSDIDRARTFLERDVLLERDSLCCGNAARIEAERSLTGDVKHNRLNPEPAFYHPLDSDDFPPGLFLGWAGVGYALVRRMSGSRRSLFLPWSEICRAFSASKPENPVL